MLQAVLENLNNWFERNPETGVLHGVVRGSFRVAGGSIELPEGFLADGQHFRVVGSVFNDGLHSFPASGMTDEEFTGAVYALAIPAQVIELADEVSAWVAKYQVAVESPYQSESFGGYSYTKAAGSNSDDGARTWQAVFRPRLNRWRKL